MVETLTTPAEVTIAPLRPHGVLTAAAPAPEGWELGGVQVPNSCGKFQVVGGCASFESDAPSGAEASEFGAFLIQEDVVCGTAGSADTEAIARSTLLARTDDALAHVLLNGIASSNDDTTLLEATPLGDASDIIHAVSLLEESIGESMIGQGALHAPSGVAAYLMSAGLIDQNGRSPAGHPWIISGAYPTESGEFTLYATGKVWASVGPIEVGEVVDRKMNRRIGRASRVGIVAFDTCLNVSINYAPTI